MKALFQQLQLINITGKYDNVASIVIKVNDDTHTFLVIHYK